MIKVERPLCPNAEALKTNYKHPDNKEALRIAAHDKCMYCESKISHIDYAHVEHIKPKAAGKYPELKFTWDNLGYACPKCNNIKSNKFNDVLPFIDPYTENPSDNIYAHGSLLFQKNGSERGELTIIDIDLNRVELIEKRQNKINEIQVAMNACYRTNDEGLRNKGLEQLRQEAGSDKEYSLTVKAMFAAHGN